MTSSPMPSLATLEGAEAMLGEARERVESTAPMAEPEMAEESSEKHGWGQEAETEEGRDVA